LNHDAKMRAMHAPLTRAAVVVFCLIFSVRLHAQPSAATDETKTQLEILTKKIDEQNTKIDALSQQILKLDQRVEAIRPGVIVGEATPAPPASAPTAAAASPVAAAGGTAHVVSKGETLTSIAKAHKVGVSDLQKYNRIENDRALQIGQTIMIPPAPGASPTPSATPNE
jgi:LysM repeat protein